MTGTLSLAEDTAEILPGQEARHEQIGQEQFLGVDFIWPN